MEYRDLKAQYQKYKNEIDDAVQEVLLSTAFISGRQVTELEGQLAEYTGVRHCITCANGTDALILALMAWDIKAGDAVFLPDFTFFATGECVSIRGAEPVFVDVDRNTFNIDTIKLERAIRRTIQEGKLTPKVILPVDLFGLPADYPEIHRIAKKYGLLVLEDSAQGFGGSYRGKKAGSFGDIATTSFFPAKPLGCYGDGGAIFTDDDRAADLIRSYRVHGKGRNKYDNVRIGLNSRLDTIQAAVLQVKLMAFRKHELDDVNRICGMYHERLKGVVEIPVIPDGYISSFAQYTIKLESKEQRDRLKTSLEESGIPSMIYYVKPMHRQAVYAGRVWDENDFSVTNELCDIVLSLPMHPYLSETDVGAVCGVIRRVIGPKEL